MKSSDLFLAVVVFALCACTTLSDRPSDAVRNELMPTGKLGIALAVPKVKASKVAARGDR